MKIEWLVTNVTAVESRDRVERAIMGAILVWPFSANSRRFCDWGGALCSVGTLS